MLKIPRKTSAGISIALSVMFFIVCIAGAVAAPYISEMFINARDNIGLRSEIGAGGRVYVLVLVYLMIAVAMLADALLFILLLCVRSGNVFTSKSVALIRGVSWCCFLMCGIFCALGIYFRLSFIVAFAAVFLGLCLRVVKNVIEEATEIKSENDLTV